MSRNLTVSCLYLGGYAWQDGSPAYFIPWDNGEPTKSEHEACVELQGHNMMYNNLRCDLYRGFICMVPKSRLNIT